MWAVLRYGRGGIVETFESFVVKRGHREVDFAFVIVPIEVDLDIFAASVINRDIIMFLEGVNEVIGIVVRDVLDTKIVDNKGELKRTCVMLPQTRQKPASLRHSSRRL